MPFWLSSFSSTLSIEWRELTLATQAVFLGDDVVRGAR
jgi:hypothetical protein